MPASVRPWREAIAVLAAAGWSERDIALVLGISLATVCRVVGVRVWEVPPMPPVATCAQRVADGYCNAPVPAGRALCDAHWRLAWPA